MTRPSLRGSIADPARSCLMLVTLGTFRGVEADIVLGRLQAEGIDAVASGRGLASLYPLAVTVLVEDHLLPAARRILDDPA